MREKLRKIMIVKEFIYPARCGPDVCSAAVLGNILCNKYSSDEMLRNLPLPAPAVSFHFIGKIVIYLLCQSNGMHWESASDESVSNAS